MPAKLTRMIACCDAPFMFLFYTQQKRRSLPRALSLSKWKGRTLQRSVRYATFISRNGPTAQRIEEPTRGVVAPLRETNFK